MTASASVWIFAALLGPCLGSYATTAALRTAEGRQSTFGRSQCDHCNRPLNFALTTPIIAFAWQRGACSVCGASIDPAHLVGELAGAVVLLSAIAVADLGRSILLSVMGLLLLANAVYDAKTRKLLDGVTLAVAGVDAALALTRSIDTLVLGLCAAGLTFILLEGVRQLFFLLWKKPGLGFGDVKLMAALAIWTGMATPWVTTMAALIGMSAMLIRPSADRKLAFGPCISLAAWAIGIGGEGRLWPMSI